MTSLAEIPGASQAFNKMFNSLTETLKSESDRGSIIIGAAKVEDALTDYLEKIIPNKSKTYKKKLFEYPGLLSSFSAKIELSYCFRYINENLYTTLNALRKIRNQAAHSSNSFKIEDLREQFSGNCKYRPLYASKYK